MNAKDYVLALKQKGFTQTQISEASGIPQPTISKISRGEVKDVMSRNYRALQSAFKKMKPRASAVLAAQSTEG